MPPAVTLQGSRVRLEPLTPSHVDALVRAATESRDTYDFTLVPADHVAMTRYVQAALEDQGTGWALPFAIYDLHSQAVVGATRFLDLDYWTWPPPGRRDAPLRDPMWSLPWRRSAVPGSRHRPSVPAATPSPSC